MTLKSGLKFIFLSVAIISSGTAFGAMPTNSLPRVFLANPKVLADAKAEFETTNSALKPAFDRLLAEANRALGAKPQSVMDKRRVPPSGDKHDYVSQAPYFWPQTNADGVVKYIRRDGERNPESEFDSDAGRLAGTCSNVSTLALAFYFTGDEKYADKATQLLRVFFLNPETKMNPNLNFGQGIPGEVDGRAAGLISARGFVDLMDALSLLENSKSWTPDDHQQMRAWLEKYLDWLTTSKIGVGEMDAKNNHGSFCDDQAAAIALYLGKTNYARQLLLQQTNRIAHQIEADGHEPFELARTKSFGYSSFNLRALMDMASLAQNQGIDLWHFRGTNGGSIYRAIWFMAQYADPTNKWPFQQIHGYNRDGLADLILRAAPHYRAETHLADELRFYQPTELVSNRCRLLFKTAAIPGEDDRAGKKGAGGNSSGLDE
jgi:hypothetical protein